MMLRRKSLKDCFRPVERIFCLMFLVLAVCSSTLPAQDNEEKIKEYERNIQTFRIAIGNATNEVERAELQRRLSFEEQDLVSLRRHMMLEAQENELVSAQRENCLYVLEEALVGIDNDVSTPQLEAGRLRDKIIELKSKREALEEELKVFRQDPQENAEAIVEHEQLIYTIEEEILLEKLRKDVQELRLNRNREAIRISDEIEDLTVNRRPTIRALLARNRDIRRESKLRQEALEKIESLSKRRADVEAELALTRAKFSFTHREIDILGDKRRYDSSKELKQQQRIAKEKNEMLGKRIALQEEQLKVLDEALALAGEPEDLYRKEIAVLEQCYSTLLHRYLRAIFLPVVTIAVVVAVYWILSCFVFPVCYKQDRLFVARRMGKYATFLVILIVLSVFFLDDLKPIATALGIAGAAIVIALQDLCSSFAGWFTIVFSRKVSVGDRVEIDGKCGDVLDVQLLRTTLVELNNWLNIDEPTGRVVVIPNSFIFKSTVFNYSHVHPYIWNRIEVTVTFETPSSEAEEVLTKVLEEETREDFARAVEGATRMVERYGTAYTTYKPKIYSIIGDSGIVFNLIFVSHYKQRTTVRNRINARIISEFEKNQNLQFAYPTQRQIPTTQPGMLHVTMDGGLSGKGED